MPGIDDAYLAMDTEEGVEVVWNEVIYSQSHRKGAHKDSKVWHTCTVDAHFACIMCQQEKLKRILQGLTNMKVLLEFVRYVCVLNVCVVVSAPEYCKFLRLLA